jgi:hypothetical protein
MRLPTLNGKTRPRRTIDWAEALFWMFAFTHRSSHHAILIYLQAGRWPRPSSNSCWTIRRSRPSGERRSDFRQNLKPYSFVVAAKSMVFKEWPLAFERSVMVSTVHPEEAKRSIYDGPGEPDPLEVVIAAEALKHRYRALISILRRGELEGRGLPTTAGHSDVILRSIWSHEDFHFGANAGDVLQDNPEPTGRHDRLIRRWIGVVLQRSNSSDQRIHPLGKMFHGKPPVHDELLSTTSVLQAAPIQRSKAVARVETKVASRMACEAWLKGIMAGSQDQRTFTIEELWAQAQKKWPGTLSERQFLAARGEAIRATRAFAWGAGGAPKKARRPNHRGD